MSFLKKHKVQFAIGGTILGTTALYLLYNMLFKYGKPKVSLTNS